MRDPIIGIDLGTSNTVVAHVDDTGQPQVLADDNNYKIHPSVVSFHPNGGVVVGAAAKQRKVIDPQNTIYSVKRLIGRSFRSPEVQTSIGRAPFKIKEGEQQAPIIVTRAGEFAVPEISAIVLDYVRNIAAERLNSVSVNRAVVTVPASFNDAQRSATATAGSIANLEVVRVLNEPTAAALAYGNTRNLKEIIAVYDFGGGTFDITILKLEDQVYEVLGTAGDTFLGGDDLDERIVDKMVAKFLAENRLDLRTNEVSMMRLRAVAEQTKIELSRRSRAVVRIDEIAYGARGKPLNLHIEITRDEFVSQVADIIDRTFPVCQEALALAGLGIDQINDVILVGGTTKIPYVRDQVAKFFTKAARNDVNPEDAVALGAALQASALERSFGKSAAAVAAIDLAAADEDTSESTQQVPQDDISAPTQVPMDLATGAPRVKRITSGYATPKPDTSYTVTRGGARDVFGKDQQPPAIPLGRMTKTIPVADLPPVAPVQARTTAPGVTPPRAPTPPPIPAKATQRQAAQTPPRPPAIIPPPPPIIPVPPPMPRTRTGDAKTSDASPSFSGEIDSSPGLPPGETTYPGLVVPTAGAPTIAFDDRETSEGTESFSSEPGVSSAGSASFTDAERLAPAKAPTSFSDEDQFGGDSFAGDSFAGDSFAGSSASFSDENMLRGASAFDGETQERLVPPAPVAAPGRPVPAALHNARTMIAPPPSPVANAQTIVAKQPSVPAGLPPPGRNRPPTADPFNPASTAKGFQPDTNARGFQPVGPATTARDFQPDTLGPASTAKGFQPVPATGANVPPTFSPPGYSPGQSIAPSTTAPGAPGAGLPAMPILPGSVPIVPGGWPVGAQLPSPNDPPPRAPVVLEVTPRGLGIGTVGGFCEELIRRNSRIPAAQKKLFTTSRDAQNLVRIVICQGESRRMQNNTVIGDLILNDLPPRPRGETSIEVTFSLDASGILQVRARDAHTGREQSATLDLVGGMPARDVASSRDRIAALRR